MNTNLKELTDFLDKYSISYTIENDIVVAGDIILRNRNISELPESIGNLKCNYINLGYNNISKLPESFGNLRCIEIDLSDNNISELPESISNIKCCNDINLNNNKIIKLPDSICDLKCNGIYFGSNKISELPDNFGNIKCNYISLQHNNLSELPVSIGNLKCISIYLRNNSISELPDNFGNLKCNYIYLDNNKLTTKYTTKRFEEIEITEEYIYCDGILTWIKGVKKLNEYIVYLGELDYFVVTKDNLVFAHGDSIRQAIADLIFKLSDRDASKYKTLNLDEQLSIEEAIVMYRTITGACSYGVESFMLNKPFNDTISINEINSLLNNDFGAEIFRNFFNI